MLKIGRYRIAFGWACWIQTHIPTTVWCPFGLIWIFKEAKPTDVGKRKRFPLGTQMIYNGRRYHYYKAGRDINVGPIVGKEDCDHGVRLHS